MDMTLVEVQRKFALIIQDMLKKPTILSQFAVWLDLRLAEYKANGYLSLDCSGEKPNPFWLSGLKIPQSPDPDSLRPPASPDNAREDSTIESTQSDSDMSDSIEHPSKTSDVHPEITNTINPNTPQTADSLTEVQHTDLEYFCPDIVIKQEAEDPVLRINIIPGLPHKLILDDQSGMFSHGGQPGTITSADSFQGFPDDMDDIANDGIFSPAKKRKTGESSHEPSNQSLLSIIEVEDFKQEGVSVVLDEVRQNLDHSLSVKIGDRERITPISSQPSFILGKSSTGTEVRGDLLDTYKPPGSKLGSRDHYIRCIDCRKVFSTQEWNRKHRCNVCEKCHTAFSSKLKLRHHELDCTGNMGGQRGTKCRVCEHEFTTPNGLRKHKCAYCQHCDRLYSSWQAFEKHRCRIEQIPPTPSQPSEAASEIPRSKRLSPSRILADSQVMSGYYSDRQTTVRLASRNPPRAASTPHRYLEDL